MGMSEWGADRDRFLNPPPQESPLTKYQPRRFFMKTEELKTITLVDDPLHPDKYPVKEYQIPLDGVWSKSVYLTSDAQNPTCPLVVKYGTEYLRTLIYATVINNTGYVNKKGVAMKHELQLFPMTTGTYQDFAREAQEKEGNLKGWQIVIQKVVKQAPVTCKKRVQLVNMASPGIFKVVRYGGKFLSEWFDEADKDPEVRAALRKLFIVQVDGDGRLVRQVPRFNYDEIMRPRTPEEMAKLLRLSAPLAGAFGSTVVPSAGTGDSFADDPFVNESFAATSSEESDAFDNTDIPF